MSPPAARLPDMLDLMLPLQCGGCGAPSTRWCAACASALQVRTDQPHVITPRLDPGVPVFSLGRYAGARREAIVAVKEHGRADLVAPLAAALRTGLVRLLTWGAVDAPVTVVPAPTRRWAARRRGGDPVTRMARAASAQLPGVTAPRRCGPGPSSSTPSGCPARTANATSRVASRSCGPSRGRWCSSTTSSPPAPPHANRSASCTRAGPAWRRFSPSPTPDRTR